MPDYPLAANLSRALPLAMIIASQPVYGDWQPSLPSGAEVLMEFTGQTEPMTLTRGKEETSAGGVLGAFKSDSLGNNQVLFRSWPLQIRLDSAGRFFVEDLKRDREIVHPEKITAGVEHRYQVSCDPDGWQVTIDGVAAAFGPTLPLCLSESWGDVTIGAQGPSGVAAFRGTIDLTYYVEGYRPSDDDAEESGDGGGDDAGSGSAGGDRVTFLSAKDLTVPRSYPHDAWIAPAGSGGIELSYTPAEIGRDVVLLHARPLRVEITRNNVVSVTWNTSRKSASISLGTGIRSGRAVNIHWRCTADGWTLDVDGAHKTETVASGMCVDNTREREVFAGSRTDGLEPIEGSLDFHWYADGHEAGSGGSGGDTGDDSPGVEPRPEGVAFVGDFETGDIYQFPNLGYRKDLDYALNALPRGRNGRFAGRFEVRYGDRGFDADGDAKKVRAEAFDSGQTMGDTWWYGWSSKVDPAWRDDALRGFYVIQQFHQTNKGSPPLGQRYVDGEWSVYCNVCGNKQIKLWSDRVPRDTWIDWVYQVKWSYEDDGVIRVWKDGRQVVDYRGPTAHESRRAPYFKFGVYRNGKDTQTQVIWHDEYRRGYSRDAVDPRNY